MSTDTVKALKELYSVGKELKRLKKGKELSDRALASPNDALYNMGGDKVFDAALALHTELSLIVAEWRGMDENALVAWAGLTGANTDSWTNARTRLRQASSTLGAAQNYASAVRRTIALHAGHGAAKVGAKGLAGLVKPFVMSDLLLTIDAYKKIDSLYQSLENEMKILLSRIAKVQGMLGEPANSAALR